MLTDIGVKHGLGQHLIFIFSTLPAAMRWFYVANAAYTSTTVCIKLSLLRQYQRFFRESYRRVVILIVLVIVIVCGIAFSFMAWFPCFPIRGFWDKTMSPSAECYTFGYRTTVKAKPTLLTFAVSKLFLGIVVFLIPPTEYFRFSLKRKQVLAMTSLFAVGLMWVSGH